MKKISVVVPTYNEQDNVELLTEAIINVFNEKLRSYDYEIIFIDNFSMDDTRKKIRKICDENKKVKAIFNAKNFGQIKSPFYGLLQATGDCAVLMCADFQEPPEVIPKFVKEWEKKYKIVIGIKEKSKESKIMYFFRSCYYKVIKKVADVEQIEHFSGFGLYDKQFIEVLRNLDDPMPYLRGIVSELGYERKEVPFEQANRKFGKSKNNIFTLYDYAMVGITAYTKVFLRLSTFLGFVISGISFVIGLVYLILKLVNWDSFQAGIAPMLLGVFFMGAIQLFFIGFLGEYILNINTRIMKRPLVIEDERLNFYSDEKLNIKEKELWELENEEFIRK